MGAAYNPLLWPPTFQAAIFDFDGTLADSLYVWDEVDRTFLESRELPYDPHSPLRLRNYGFEGWASYLKEKFALPDTPEQLYQEWNDIGAKLYQDEIELRAGAFEYLEALFERGVKLALATTNDPEVVAHVLARTGLDALLSVCSYGYEVAYPKSHPALYELTAQRLGVAPERCMVFEDLQAGLESSQSIGMLTCAVGGANDRHNFEEMRRIATTSLASFTDLQAPQSSQALGCR